MACSEIDTECYDCGPCAETNYQVAQGDTVVVQSFGYTLGSDDSDLEAGLPGFVAHGGPSGSCLGDPSYSRVVAWGGTEIQTEEGDDFLYSEDAEGSGDLVSLGGYNQYIMYSWPSGLTLDIEIIDDSEIVATFVLDEWEDSIVLVADDSGVVVE
jgi:hypothetical protein